MRTNKKAGDIYSLKIDNKVTIYFQYIGVDTFQLMSDCIVLFNYRGRDTEKEDIGRILESGIWYITLTWINSGLRDNYYKKIGHVNPVVMPENVFFKSIQRNIFDPNTQQIKNIFYRRQMGTNQSTYFSSEKEFEEETQDAWEDGATPAEGLKRLIIYKLYGVVSQIQ